MSTLAQTAAPPHPTSRLRAAVHLGLGLFAAGTKLHGLNLDPLGADSFLSSARLQVVVIEVEVLLGLLLIASSWFAVRPARALSWVTMAFFGLLSAVSLCQAIDGQSSCGCFGQLHVSPWVTLGINAGIMVLLIATLRTPGQCEDEGLQSLNRPSPSGRLAPVLRIGLGAGLTLAILVGGFFLVFDNPMAALAELRRDAITVGPVVSDVGTASIGESRTSD